ncbi:4-alpha-glucanotransferase [Weeksellaceae bacterium KMM 9724]|uniref:4-alpha-glucanotransferase n=1 Tax=Profundicola chukchiensis TaxID=2961959 RepID=UPI00243D19C0|nr:4-alpha-glucanotransferase [Profundicola chukchiensis]MDG4951469.1 4-alpha-glucanotransferase [Profundicola chukchiensis]
MKLKFKVTFNSVVGQNIFITGSCKELGNWDKDKAIALSYSHFAQWSVDMKIKSKDFEYLYFIKDDRDQSITEEWSKRSFSALGSKDSYILKDAWNYPNLPEFNLNTEFFEHIGVDIPVTEQKVSKKHTHQFNISFRPLHPNESVYLLGSIGELGSWNEENAIPMHWDGKGKWSVNLDLAQVNHQFSYKYLVVNPETNILKYFEEGENRIGLPSNDDEFIIQHDTGFRQPQHKKWRGSGIAVPVFSLRSERGLGVGEFLDLIEFGKWAKEAGFSMVQILPIHDTTAKFDWTDSYPYAAISVYALHPMYLNLNALKFKLSAKELKEIEAKAKELNQHDNVDYELVNNFKTKFLKKYFKENKEAILGDKSFKAFLKDNEEWVKPYAAFSVLRDKNKTADFTQWKSNSKSSKATLTRMFGAKSKDLDAVMFYVFVQWQLHEQLSKAVDELHNLNLTLKGDLPIGIYRHSVDAWWNPELFHMDQQAGAPPDDFAVLGQNWEFPTYNWPRMKEDDFAWWKSRFQFMSRYFDAFRIDHILGFFRIWQIPLSATQGILGRFEPALPISLDELNFRGIHLDLERLVEPYLHYDLIRLYFGSETEEVVHTYFDFKNDLGELKFKEEYNTQRKIKNTLAADHGHLERLLELAANVLFIKEDADEVRLHPRYGINETNNFKWLPKDTQDKLYALYLDYFYNRQEQFWKAKGLEKLPALKQATNMLTCGEDLGMVPKVVPQVMNDLAIMSLQVQRMPSDEELKFSNPHHAPYLSVVSPSSHDTSTLRQWWKEDREATQYFYNTMMGKKGAAPEELSEELLSIIVDQHLYSPALLSVIPLQEFLGMHSELRNPNEEIERINVPAVFPHYWRYRMHVNISDLINHKEFTNMLKDRHANAGRG